jgi:cytochrome c
MRTLCSNAGQAQPQHLGLPPVVQSRRLKLAQQRSTRLGHPNLSICGASPPQKSAALLVYLRSSLLAAAAALSCLLAVPRISLAADADAAQTLARQNNCFRCHSVEKAKDGPAWKDVAKKYSSKPKPEAEQRLVTHLTTGEMAKFPDGHEEEHKIIKSPGDAQTLNLIDWILSLPHD